MVDRQDDTTVPTFARIFKNYVEEEQGFPLDPYQSPKLRPFEGTIPPDPLLNEENQGLLQLSNEEYSEEDCEVNGLSASIDVFWQPGSGNIKIVSTDLAMRLSNLTGCSFFPHKSSNSVGITGDRASQGLKKLKTLEKLQVSKLASDPMTTLIRSAVV